MNKEEMKKLIDETTDLEKLVKEAQASTTDIGEFLEKVFTILFSKFDKIVIEKPKEEKQEEEEKELEEDVCEVDNDEEAAGNLIDSLLLLDDLDEMITDMIASKDDLEEIQDSLSAIKDLVEPVFNYLQEHTEYAKKPECNKSECKIKDSIMDGFFKGLVAGTKEKCRRELLSEAIVGMIMSPDVPCYLLRRIVDLIVEFGKNNDLNKEAYDRLKSLV